MFERKSPVILALALAGSLFAGAAHAGRVNWSVNINVPGPVYAEPVYYAPPPVYYAPPPPVYYAPPPPVYYRPRPVVVYPPAVVYHRPGRAIVGGSWERHRGHGRDEWRGDRPGRDGGRGHYGGEGRRGGW